MFWALNARRGRGSLQTRRGQPAEYSSWGPACVRSRGGIEGRQWGKEEYKHTTDAEKGEDEAEKEVAFYGFIKVEQ